MLSTSRFEDALLFASQIHANQTRTGTKVPYISHLLAVASLVMECGGWEVAVIAALLHDAAEDQGGRRMLKKIEKRFGPTVAAVVAECTDAWESPKPDWRKRKEEYIANLPQASSAALLVSAADKLHNLRSIRSDMQEIGEAVWKRFKGGRAGAIWYYRSLLKIYQDCKVAPRLTGEIAKILEEIDPPFSGWADHLYVALFDDYSPEKDCHLSAHVDLKSGDFTLSGQDLSDDPALLPPFCDDDYEYYATVKAADKPRLLAALQAKTAPERLWELQQEYGQPDQLLLMLAKEHFGSFVGFGAFEVFCKQQGIETSFWCW